MLFNFYPDVPHIQFQKHVRSWHRSFFVKPSSFYGKLHGLSLSLAATALVFVSSLTLSNCTSSDEGSNTPTDTTPPEFRSAMINGTMLTITFNEDIAFPLPTGLKEDFTVMATPSGETMERGTVSSVTDTRPGDSMLELILERAISAADAVMIAYTADENHRITDLSGNILASFSLMVVQNNNDNDADDDGLSDASDNCPLIANPTQKDDDNDDAGNICDIDDDGNGLIEVHSLDMLNNIRNKLDGTAYNDGNGDNTTGCGGRNAITDCSGYELTRDLDFMDANEDGTPGDEYIYNADPTENAKGWLPLAHDDTFNAPRFTSIFHGRGYTIRNLRITQRRDQFTGLFGIIIGGKIDSLGLENVDIIGTRSVGGLAGVNSGTISNCYATGTVSGTNSMVPGGTFGGEEVGGLAGVNSGTISNSYSTVRVSGIREVGGLVGRNLRGNISNSYATGTVSGDIGVGGLVGQNDSSTISNSYSTGRVTGVSDVGGLVGFDGTIGLGVSNSYWNTETSGKMTGIGGSHPLAMAMNVAGLKTEEMYVQGNLDGFMFRTNANESADTHPWLPPVNNAATPSGKVFPRLRGVSRNAQILAFPSPALMPSSSIDGASTALSILSSYAFLSPVANSSAAPRFTSSNPSVATVDAVTGMVTAKGIGETMITITRTGNDDYAEVSVSRVLRVPPFMGSGTMADPFQIRTVDDLNAIRGSFLADTFELMNDVDFSGTPYASGSGWQPIGHDTEDGSSTQFTQGLFQGIPFTGVFHGGGYVIRNLRIARSSEDFLGLFGRVAGGRIDDLGLVNMDIAGALNVGGLVGRNDSGTVSDCYSTGTVAGLGTVGGLVGRNNGTVGDSYSSGTVSGDVNVGGLVGRSVDRVNNSYATGMVRGLGNNTGGLVGYNDGTVSDCYSTGTVIGGTLSTGGLVGRSDDEVSTSYATGMVSGTIYVGGLVGRTVSGSITNSYSTGTATGTMGVGGLVGRNGEGILSNSYSTGDVLGTNDVGGLVGLNGYTMVGLSENSDIIDSYSTGKVSGNTNVGGLVGFNSSITIQNSYWNTATSGTMTGIGAGTTTGTEISVTGRITTEIYVQANFVGWDFTNIWFPPSNTSGSEIFPHLRDVSRNAQVMTFAAIGNKTVGHPVFALDHSFLSPVTLSSSMTTFTSSDMNVATVSSDGMVTIRNAGTTTITVTRTGTDHVPVSASQELTVTNS